MASQAGDEVLGGPIDDAIPRVKIEPQFS